jgi:aerobic C4-dicarboxylate transport protein
MMISPVIFCTIVLGIGSIRQAAKVGKVGGLALLYFVAMSTVALVIGLLVGNILHPGQGLAISEAGRSAAQKAASGEAQSTTDFLLHIIPTTLFSPLTGDSVLSTLMVALLVGFAVQALGSPGQAVLRGIKLVEKVVFCVLSMIMWLAPIGAFGAIAAVVGQTGWSALAALGQIMLGFYITCFLFIVVVLGTLLRLVTGLSIFKLMKYLTREYLLIVSTSSSESALPRLIAKMEHLGVSRPVVGIDRFMSEARALTNFSGNAVATLLIGKWVGEYDGDRARLVLDGGAPFDEATMLDEDDATESAPAEPAGDGTPGRVPVGATSRA